jgi:exonuclease I
MLLTLCSCSLPDVSVEKKQKSADAAGAGFFTKGDDHAASDIHASDSTYLATVHVRFNETGTQSFSFDVRRDRRDTISVNMEETEQTSTYLHLGYTRSEGGIAGLRFTFRF